MISLHGPLPDGRGSVGAVPDGHSLIPSGRAKREEKLLRCGLVARGIVIDGVNLRELAVQVGKRLLKGFSIPRISRRFEIAQHTGARKQQPIPFPEHFGLLRAQALLRGIAATALLRLNLRFDSFAFPTSSHGLSAAGAAGA